MKLTRQAKKRINSNLSYTGALVEGRNNGYETGWTDGRYHGKCEAVMQSIPQDDGFRWNIRVLYVGSNNSLPYIPIDQGIMDGLRGLVHELQICNPTDDVVRVAQEMRPDLVLVLDCINSFPLDKVIAIRSMGIKTAVWFTDDPYYTDVTVNLAPHYDYVFTTELSCVQFYNELGCPQVHYLPFAISSAVFRPKRVKPSFRTDICFIGSAYWNRVAFFDSIAGYLADKNVLISGYWWDRLSNFYLLKNKIRLDVWMSPEETLSYYCGAKIVINLHRIYNDNSFNQNSHGIPALSVNPRTFDICSSGAFQLTDVRDDIHRVYMPGHDMITYSSAPDLVEKIEYYLAHEEERQQIALRGLARTLRDHTFRGRLHQLFQIVTA